MDKHPIESIMTTTMENIRDMIDVNTIVGDAIPTSDGCTVIPISRRHSAPPATEYDCISAGRVCKEGPD